ncbi:hypothetical protein CRENBAI_021253 [Crenichthys baileyi]|uniref:Uncharacterized protein n=1 Tax=Crenichthys baileyi TaxID=28760 RepID=A0AAV9S3Q9_9TELE
MFKPVPGTTPFLSSCESPFHSFLQPCFSENSSWEHHPFAYLPVHTPTQSALLSHNYSGNTRREHQFRKPLSHFSCLTRCGKDLPPPTNHHPPTSRSILRSQ